MQGGASIDWTAHPTDNWLDWVPGDFEAKSTRQTLCSATQTSPEAFLQVNIWLTVNNKKYTKISKPKPGYKKKVSKDVYLNRTFN